MDRRQALLSRLDAIAAAVAAREGGLALLGLGSVGLELDRLDEYSDLDFFVVVQSGCKAGMLHDLTWLGEVCPIAYCFRNTADGYKLLFEDGIYCEFAIFELHELGGVAFVAPRIVWRAPGCDEALLQPQVPPPAVEERTEEWLVGEAVTCLYVGLCRYLRGEKLSAQRFIQQYAVDRILELSERIAREQLAPQDAFARERRFEQRFPLIADELPRFIQGYALSAESAEAILAFLDLHFGVEPAMRQAILDLSQLARRERQPR